MTENVFRWEVDSPPDLHQPRMRVQVVWVEEYDKLLRENQRLQREVDAFLAAKGKASEPVAPHFEMRGKCECGLLWQVGSGFAFEVKEVFCTCGRTVPVNRAAVKSGAPHQHLWENDPPRCVICRLLLSEADTEKGSASLSGCEVCGDPNHDGGLHERT